MNKDRLSQPLKITSAHTEVVKVPIHVPFAIAKETLEHASLAIISLGDEHDHTGLGEASPFPSLTGDDITTATPAARALASSLVGLTPLEGLKQLRTCRAEVFPNTPTAYVAVETALIDLHARQLGIPMARLFGLAEIKETATDITLPLMTPQAVANFCELFRSYEFKQIKVKVSGRISEDLEMIEALLRLSPPDTELTLDGNQGFQFESALKLIDALGKRGIKPLFFEQPLPEDDWAGLAKLTAATPMPICLDETVKSAADVLHVVQEKTARMINLKIMKAGIEETLRIITVARAAGLKLMIGGMLESEIAMGTSLQILAGTGAIEHVDLDTPFFFTKRLTKKSPWHGKKAVLKVPTTPGHGLELSSEHAHGGRA